MEMETIHNSVPVVEEFDVLVGGRNEWTQKQLSLEKIITQANTHEVLIAFLPNATTLTPQVQKQISSTFHIPHSYWRSIATEANSFFGSRGLLLSASQESSRSIFYRFLIKVPLERTNKNLKVKGLYPLYHWDKISFSVSWIPGGGVRILCFDMPGELKDVLVRVVRGVEWGVGRERERERQLPLRINNLIVEEIVARFDVSVWAWRDVVRDLEKTRPVISDQPPDPDYIRMHEVARHIIHSSETLAIALNTLNSMLQAYKSFLGSKSDGNDRNEEEGEGSGEVIAELEMQISLLRCVHLRSDAIHERLKNEINLAFNLAAQYDSRATVQISTNTSTDSSAMKTISILGLVFLPGTFVCSLFSSAFFNFTPATGDGIEKWSVSGKLWVYFVVAVPVTLATIGFWFLWTRWEMRNSKRAKLGFW